MGPGVAGAGIGLATQGVLSNMVAGLTIIFTKPYRVGEYIAIVGVEGQLADSAVQIAIRPWVAVGDYGAVQGELNVALLATLRERGIAIPYPQREVRLLGHGA